MSKSKNKLPKFLLQIVEFLLFITICIGFAKVTASTNPFDQQGFLLGLGLSLVAGIILVFVLKIHRKFDDKTTYIEDITDETFSIIITEHKTKFKWEQIEKMEIYPDRHALTFETRHNKMNLDLTNQNWYKFFKTIPNHLLNDEDLKFRKELFSDLVPCTVCGYIAVKEGYCFACQHETYPYTMKGEYHSENEYLRSKQLTYFSRLQSIEKKEAEKKDNPFFNIADNYRIVINQEELDNYKG